jgi:hypothetical protein
MAVWTCLAAVAKLSHRLPVWAGGSLGQGFVGKAPLPLKLLVTAVTITVRCRPAAAGQACTGGAATCRGGWVGGAGAGGGRYEVPPSCGPPCLHTCGDERGGLAAYLFYRGLLTDCHTYTNSALPTPPLSSYFMRTWGGCLGRLPGAVPGAVAGIYDSGVKAQGNAECLP